MEKLSILAVAIAVAFIFCGLFALPVMWLWNVVVVAALTVAQPITFWQALGLLFLCSLLFKPYNIKS